jgi:death-on-curing family protein
MNAIEIYRTKEGNTEVEVRFEQDTIWLNQKQIAAVFGTEVPAINKHVKNIIKSGELKASATISKMETVQTEGKRKVKRTIELYNLDMIISVGYRINSKRATQFRIWATRTLKDHLIKGYTVNEVRLKKYRSNLHELERAVKLIQQSGSSTELSTSETRGLLEIISSYTRSFVLLNQFDGNNMANDKLSENITYEIQYEEALKAITELKKQLINRKEASDLFGSQKDDSFKGTLQNIIQTFGGQYLYPTIEEQAAHLLYFVIKNHAFTDGNKRIGAFLFIWFLEKNKHRFKTSGEVKINDNGLTALALLVAQSNPEDKDIIVKLIVNLIADR